MSHTQLFTDLENVSFQLDVSVYEYVLAGARRRGAAGLELAQMTYTHMGKMQ